MDLLFSGLRQDAVEHCHVYEWNSVSFRFQDQERTIGTTVQPNVQVDKLYAFGSKIYYFTKEKSYYWSLHSLNSLQGSIDLPSSLQKMVFEYAMEILNGELLLNPRFQTWQDRLAIPRGLLCKAERMLLKHCKDEPQHLPTASAFYIGNYYITNAEVIRLVEMGLLSVNGQQRQTKDVYNNDDGPDDIINYEFVSAFS